MAAEETGRQRTAPPLSERRRDEPEEAEGRKGRSKKLLFYCSDPRHHASFAHDDRFFEVDQSDADDLEEGSNFVPACPQGHVHHVGPLKEREIPVHLIELEERLGQPSVVQ